MSTVDEARKQLGELFLIGFEGLELGDATAAFISQAGIGGVVLFAPNYESPAQVAELINQVQEARQADLPLWICVDHEGGRVQRFKKGFTRLPTAAAIGHTDSPKLTFELSDLVSKELRAVGVNVNFAPVADIQTNPKNPIIGDRAFGTTEEIVSKHVSAFVRGHLVNDVQACVKHFPGHGDTSVDSHLALPKVDTPLETLHEREFKPFTKAFKSRCAMVMTAHVLMTALDPKLPATLSRAVLTGLLRGDLRYSRLIVSDDLEMKAITDHYGADEAPRMAVEAGCDLLIYRSEGAARKAYEALLKALDAGTLSPARVLESAERSRLLKEDCLMPYQAVAVTDVAAQIGLPETAELVKKIDSPA